jgi:hypothetical protein
MRRIWDSLYNGAGFRGKTLWSWLELLIVPVFIAGATVVFSLYQQRIEDDRVRQSVLESYLQDISELLLREGLAEPRPVERQQLIQHYLVHQIARANTLTTVRQLDGARKGLLLQFLYDSNLLRFIECDEPDVPPAPQGEEICGANSAVPILMSGADLRGTELIDTHLLDADLSGANLSNANLSLNNLESADLLKTVLKGANLSGAHLSGAYLVTADLTGADLTGAELRNANLNAVEVKAPEGTNLPPAFWDGADLSGANLTDADLSGANLKGAKGLTLEQLARVRTLYGATLDDELREQVEKNYPHLTRMP